MKKPENKRQTLGKKRHMVVLDQRFRGMSSTCFGFYLVGIKRCFLASGRCCQVLKVNGVVYVNENVLEEKINEIKVMDREVRERERRGLIEGDEGSELEKGLVLDWLSWRRGWIRREEGCRICLWSSWGSFGDFEDEFGEDGLDSKEENKTLMFKKKFRFKSPSMDTRSTPMGFSGLKDRSVSTRDGSDLNGLFGKTDAGSLKRDSRRKDGNVHLNSVQNEVNKWEKERGDLRDRKSVV